MKRRNLIILAALAGVGVYIAVRRRKGESTQAVVSEVASNDTASTPANSTKRKSGNNIVDLLKGNSYVTEVFSPTSVSSTFTNRVYTKVEDLYGVKTSSYPSVKINTLYRRLYDKLNAKRVRPSTASLGQIGPALREIAQEGFDFGTELRLPANPNRGPQLPLGRPSGVDRDMMFSGFVS